MTSKKVFYILMISVFSVFILGTTLNAGNYFILATYAQKKKDKKINILEVCKGDYLGAGCPDSDGDGIPDHLDRCPNIPGPSSGQGCPDTDGDGIPDFMDDCPDVFGLPEFNGCPDTDGDGIPDNVDVCPKEFGLKSNNGCPTADSKVMGRESKPEENKTDLSLNLQVEENNISVFSDESTYDYKDYSDINHSVNKKFRIIEEILPDIESISSEHIINNITSKDIAPKQNDIRGEQKKNVFKSDYSLAAGISLPESEKTYLNLLLRKVSFETGRTKMDDLSVKSINSFAEILKKYTDWRLVIHSYAYDADSNYRNLQLSENRAINIKSALIKQFIDNLRIETIGHGSGNTQYNDRESFILFEIK